jgi:hypothetical protein
MQFRCEGLDLAGQLGVGFELQLLSFIVVVGFGLLEGGLAVLADLGDELVSRTAAFADG